MQQLLTCQEFYDTISECFNTSVPQTVAILFYFIFEQRTDLHPHMHGTVHTVLHERSVRVSTVQ